MSLEVREGCDAPVKRGCQRCDSSAALWSAVTSVAAFVAGRGIAQTPRSIAHAESLVAAQDRLEVVGDVHAIYLEARQGPSERGRRRALKPSCGAPRVVRSPLHQSVMNRIFVRVSQPREPRLLKGQLRLAKFIPDLPPRNPIPFVTGKAFRLMELLQHRLQRRARALDHQVVVIAHQRPGLHLALVQSSEFEEPVSDSIEIQSAFIVVSLQESARRHEEDSMWREAMQRCMRPVNHVEIIPRDSTKVSFSTIGGVKSRPRSRSPLLVVDPCAPLRSTVPQTCHKSGN